MNSGLRRQPMRPDWWGKTLAGAVLGLALSFALCGLFAWLGPGGIAAPQKVQFVMWLLAPVWMLVFSLVYLCSSAARALLWLGGANLLAYAGLFAARLWTGLP